MNAPEPIPRPSYVRPFGRAVGLAVVVGLLALSLAGRGTTSPPTPAPAPVPPPKPVVVEVVVQDEVPPPVVLPPPPPIPPAPVTLPPDPVAIASAEARLEAAHAQTREAWERTRSEAENLIAAFDRAVETRRGAVGAASLIQAPTTRRIEAVKTSRLLASERDRLDRELTVLEQAPRPERRPLIDKAPMARPPESDETHFELRKGRVSFLDIDRLIDLVRDDARLRVRMARDLRPIRGEVGPVGAFSMKYELSPSAPTGVADLLLSGKVTFNLRGWEVVPESPVRGEPYSLAILKTSDFARALNRLDHHRNAVTLWIYPDSFDLYRKLRDVFHGLGFVVSARPLPEGVAIRGSPGGTVSAAQ